MNNNLVYYPYCVTPIKKLWILSQTKRCGNFVKLPLAHIYSIAMVRTQRKHMLWSLDMVHIFLPWYNPWDDLKMGSQIFMVMGLRLCVKQPLGPVDMESQVPHHVNKSLVLSLKKPLKCHKLLLKSYLEYFMQKYLRNLC